MSFLSAVHPRENMLALDLGEVTVPEREEPTGRRKRPRVPDERRKRVKVACTDCRKNKLRCNGCTPCERCADAGRDCEYIEITKTTESSPCVLMQPDERDSRDEKFHLMKRIFEKTHPNVSTDIQSLRDYYSHLQSTPSEPQSVSESIRDKNLFDENLSGQTAEITVVNQGKTYFEGGSSLWYFFRSVRRAFSDEAESDESASNNDHHDAEYTEKSIHKISDGFGIDWVTGALHALPPRDVVTFLTNTFFQFTQANYFCLHPEIFSQKLDAFYEGKCEFQPRDAVSSKRSIEFISLLFMVLAMGSQFAEVGEAANGQIDGHMNDFLKETNIPDGPISSSDISGIKIPTPRQNPGWKFYEVSRKLLPDIISSSSMTTIQICLLQGIYLPSTASQDAACNLLGLALRMAINMGLHRSFVNSSLPKHVRELRNRLWWSIYVADRLYNIDMGWPLAISDSEIDAPFPTDMPGWNDTQGRPVPIDGLISLLKLCRVMGRIVDAVYCKAASDKRSTIRPSEFQQLKRELAHWKNNLPSHINLENAKTRSEAHLALTYHQSIILLTRSCLNLAAEPANSVSVHGVEAGKFLQIQAQECVSAAAASIKVISSLRNRSLLCPFSFRDSLYCSSALYVLILASRKLPSVVTVPGRIFRQGIHALVELSEGSEIAALSLKGIVHALSLTPGSHDNIRPKITTTSHTDYEAVQQRGRMAWKAWKTTKSFTADPSLPTSTETMIEQTVSDIDTREVEYSPISDQLHDLEIPKYTFNGQQTHDDTTGITSLLGFSANDFLSSNPETRTESQIEVFPGISEIAPFWIPQYLDLEF